MQSRLPTSPGVLTLTASLSLFVQPIPLCRPSLRIQSSAFPSCTFFRNVAGIRSKSRSDSLDGFYVITQQDSSLSAANASLAADEGDDYSAGLAYSAGL